MRFKVAAVSILLSAGLLLSGAAMAQEYPTRPIKLIVPFAPGGGADAVARIVAQRVSEPLGQPVVVENRTGAAAIIGTLAVAKAEPDGYTLLLGQSGPISINPAVYKDLKYDPIKDFAPITRLTNYPYIMVTNNDFPAKNVQELVAQAKAKPGAVTYGSYGIGGANHLVALMFEKAAGIKMLHVPYRGTAPAVTDLIGGQLNLVFSDPFSALPNVRSGKLRALAVTGKDRSPVAPEVPTVAESGYPGFDAVGWHGILAPAGTSPAIVNKLNAAIVKVLADPETKALLAAQATEAVGDTPQQFETFIKDDIAKWSAIAKEANVVVE
ncbi:tripartite tricarboxylate transporter substrate binding protein [Aquabacter sp. CN5-332]|uniref:Bug family tripartite tricarboxylate transporter substrate binding protein n=1 Tax=Aquabacter sp. CN5-332 TaxID=3156608 RepID=UPI0032B35FD3